MARLTRKERDAVMIIVSEFLAGHDTEMTRACGVASTMREAEQLLDRLASALRKLT